MVPDNQHLPGGAAIRRRRPAGYGIVALLALAGGFALASCGGSAAAPPGDFERSWQGGAAQGFHMVIVTLDTTRADRIGCHGYDGAATPVLDGLAAEGVRFADAVSCVPMTLPAHASMFTGQDPPTHGVRLNGRYKLDPARTTLAETLREQGYDTAAFVASFVLDPRYGIDQGFRHYDAQVSGKAGMGTQRSGAEVTDSALEWLGRRTSTKPLLLWAHYFDPHASYTPPEPYRTEFADRPYDGEVAYMDAQVGRLLEGLWRRLDPQRTVVLVAGDHGESLGGHDESGHSHLIYGSTQRVPMLLWAPGIDRQPYLVDDAVVTITDVYPTVLDLLGIEREGEHDGRSFLACRSLGDRAVYMETLRPYLDHRWAPLLGIRRHRDKYILAPRPEFYDLVRDPGETDNRFPRLDARQAAVAEELITAMGRWLDRDPEHGAAWMLRGDIAKAEGRYERAIELYEQARWVDYHRVGMEANRRIELVRPKLEKVP